MTTGHERPAPIDEQLSAWLDDELPAAELDLLLARLASSPELHARAARYGLIGSALRGGEAREPGGELAALQLARRVGQALESEAPGATARSAREQSRLAPYAAVAGVALLALTILPLLRPLAVPATDKPLAAAVMNTGPARPASPALVVERVAAPGQSSLSPHRLTNYLVYHGEYSGTLSAKLIDSHIVNNRAYAVAVRAPDETARR